MTELIIGIGEALLGGLEGAINNANADAKAQGVSLVEFIGKEDLDDMWLSIKEISSMFDQVPDDKEELVKPLIERFELVIEALESINV